jgi:hypothetical protein
VICIAYLSAAQLVPTPSDLDAILAASHRNNRRHGVTGMLCHYEGSFLQFLEGESDDVDATYARIAADPRHTGLISLYHQEIDERLFSDWSMALARVEAIDLAQQAFCRGLRTLEFAATPAHRQLVEPFFDSFRAWIR